MELSCVLMVVLVIAPLVREVNVALPPEIDPVPVLNDVPVIAPVVTEPDWSKPVSVAVAAVMPFVIAALAPESAPVTPTEEQVKAPNPVSWAARLVPPYHLNWAPVLMTLDQRVALSIPIA